MNYDLITIILLVIFLISAISVLLIGLRVFNLSTSSSKQKRISRYVTQEQGLIGLPTFRDKKLLPNQEIGKFRDWVNERLHRLSSEKLHMKLSSAYWMITDTEYILLRYSSSAIAFLLGWLIPRNILGGIFLGGIIYLMPPMVLDRAISKRQKKFANQLLDVLVLIQGAVQSGYSLIQSLDMAVQESPSPASEEFDRVLHEINLGYTLEQSLNNLTERMENDDLQIVVTAIVINAQVGGNLSTVMGSAIDTIRDRIQLMGEIRSLTSYARYVGYMLTLMPFGLGVVLFFIQPEYFDTVKTSFITQIVFGMALGGVILGNLWIKKLVQIKV